MKILITGIAGFIGHATAKKLATNNSRYRIVGIDNLNDYYDVALKQARLSDLDNLTNVQFIQMDLSDRESIANLFTIEKFDAVIHLAAQAGVRYSIDNPHAYVDSNLVGHVNILEGCRQNNVKHLMYASSSSVYGENTKVPFAVADRVDEPISLYAATKKANELMTYTYSHLYNLPATGLRFFTVYGPWGRPDMALFKFTKAIINGTPIDVYNQGNMERDFTYIDDIVESITHLFTLPPVSDGDNTPHAVYNIGNGSPVALMSFVKAIEKATGKSAICRYLPMQAGDVPRTWADTEALFTKIGYQPQVEVNVGVKKFVDWYCHFYKIN
ncbi:NAD-dependent epimerase/dehydratase family protein [Psychrobacter sp. T6-5]|uniref:NAD-dependent epimerase/dehydratase family protein n=1 Tax=Psychrobacter sp. T6-5 TaxID=3457451 RepID=UPI003FD23255